MKLRCGEKRFLVTPTKIFWGLILLAVFIHQSWMYLPHKFSPYGGFYSCINFLEEGTLYSGQPFCSQPPLFFHIVYLIKSLTGNLFNPTLIVLAFLSQILIYFSVREILKKENLYNFYVYTLMFLLGSYAWLGKLDYTLCCGLFFLGIYFLYYFKHEHNDLVAGILFALAVLTKYIIVLPLIVLTLHQIFLLYTETKKIHIQKIVWRLVKIGAPTLVLVILFWFKYPLFIDYTVWAQLKINENTRIEALKTIILGAQREYFAAAILIIVSLAYLRRYLDKNTVLHLWLSSLILIQSFIYLQKLDISMLGASYFIPYQLSLFYLILLSFKKSKQVFALLFVLIILHPSIVNNGYFDPLATKLFDENQDKALETIEYGMHFIPPQSGRILIENQEVVEHMQKYSPHIRNENLDVTGDYKNYLSGIMEEEDTAWGPALRETVDVTEQFDENANFGYATSSEFNYTKIQKYNNRLQSGWYSLLVLSPPDWRVTQRILNKNRETILQKYCGIYVPNFLYEGDGRTYTSLYFQEQKQCEQMRRDLENYYTKNFTQICQISHKAAQVVKKEMRNNKITITQECTKHNEYPYSNKKRKSLNPLDLGIIVVLTGLTYAMQKTLPQEN